MGQHDETLDQALAEALDRLPRHSAPWALRRRLATQWSDFPVARPRRRRWILGVVSALGVAVVLLLGIAAHRDRERLSEARTALVTEAVDDHIRVLSRSSLDVVAPSLHVVRPWFAGRLDFAPVVPFAGDADLTLRGGAIERFLGRTAAAFVYQRRLHVVTLFVLRADGPAWPAGEPTAATARGFTVVLWRTGDLGYALVSDVSPVELRALADLFRAPPSRSTPIGGSDAIARGPSSDR
jgi:anti-sigma factor RsiW